MNAPEMKIKIAKYFFVVLKLISTLSLICLLSTVDWVEMNDKEADLTFTGGLFEINEGMSEGKSYSYLSDRWCNRESTNTGEFFTNEAGCTLFTDLSLAGKVMLSGEIVAIVLNLLIIIFLCVLIKHNEKKTAIIACSLISLSLQVFIFLIYYFVADITYVESCDNWNSHNNPDYLCAKDGPIYFICILVYESLSFVAQAITLCCYHKKATKGREIVPELVPTKTDEKHKIDNFMVEINTGKNQPYDDNAN